MTFLFFNEADKDSISQLVILLVFPVLKLEASQMPLVLKNPPANTGDVRDVGSIWKDPLEDNMATHSSILAWRIPWIEEPGGLGFIGSQTVGYN